MTFEELKAIVPSDKVAEFDVLIGEIKTEADPMAGLEESGVEDFVEQTPLLKSSRDRAVSKGIETNREKNWDREFDQSYRERFLKENPNETADAKRDRENEEWKLQMERRTQKAENRSFAIEAMAAAKLDPALVDRVVGMTDDETKANIDFFVTHNEAVSKTAAEAERTKILGENGQHSVDGDGAGKGKDSKLLQDEESIERESKKPDPDWTLINESIAALS